MSSIRRIVKNIRVLFISKIISQAINFLCLFYIARYLGAAEYGVLAFAVAFATIFGVFLDFGFHPLTVREVARDKKLSSKYLSNLIGIKTILAILILPLALLVLLSLNYPEKTLKVVFCIELFVILNSFSLLFYSVFQALEQMEYQAAGNVLNSTIILLGAITLCHHGGEVLDFAILYSVSALIGIIYCVWITIGRFPEIYDSWRKKIATIDLDFLKPTLKEAMPFGLGLVFMTIFYWIDSVMLSFLKGDMVVGLYNVAYRMVLALLLIPTTVISAIYPVMSKLYQNSNEQLMFTFEKSFTYSVILGFPIATGTTILAKRFILLIFGPGYSDSIIILQILVWSALFIFMSITYGNLFNCLNQQRIVLKITAICALANILLNALLIPNLGMVGASITTVATEIISLFLCIYSGKKVGAILHWKQMLIIIIKVSLASLLMGLFVLHFHYVNLLILIILSIFFYFSIFHFIFKGFDSADLSILRVLMNTNTFGKQDNAK